MRAGDHAKRTVRFAAVVEMKSNGDDRLRRPVLVPRHDPARLVFCRRASRSSASSRQRFRARSMSSGIRAPPRRRADRERRRDVIRMPATRPRAHHIRPRSGDSERRRSRVRPAHRIGRTRAFAFHANSFRSMRPRASNVTPSAISSSLQLVRIAARARAHFAFRIHDAMPWNVVAAQRVERVSDLSRVAVETGERRDLTVRCNASTRDAAHRFVDRFVTVVHRRRRIVACGSAQNRVHFRRVT